MAPAPNSPTSIHEAADCQPRSGDCEQLLYHRGDLKAYIARMISKSTQEFTAEVWGWDNARHLSKSGWRRWQMHIIHWLTAPQTCVDGSRPGGSRGGPLQPIPPLQPVPARDPRGGGEGQPTKACAGPTLPTGPIIYRTDAGSWTASTGPCAIDAWMKKIPGTSLCALLLLLLHHKGGSPWGATRPGLPWSHGLGGQDKLLHNYYQ
ncbi:Hypothetical predicted protein [Pelobates cultripes]|uniref:Uncharacterized protein n=1 Tax=Pelobates cultripes TaxID=61616 RepID=A0AAD1QWV8_PELCU|nr:Hypothetical predicted protein [Pelobates cultripes]